MKKTRIFDTDVQLLKYKVLKEVASYAFEDKLDRCHYEIPQKIVEGPEATMRCCIYKERAIVEERIELALGGDKSNPNVIETLSIACDECPVQSYSVGDSCRGCIAHRCENICPVGAITIVNQKAHIDYDKCIECGKCASVCPFSAIKHSVRPCESACKINAIHMDKNKKAEIDNETCISCGACVYQCPFGAIVDKSFITDAVRILKGSENNTKYQVYAIIAPSISAQFSYAKIGQVVTGLKQLGFFSVVEAALGADMVAYKEAAELAEKGKLTSSCCPAFVSYIEKSFPDLKPLVSHNVSPMMEIAKYIKASHPDCKTIFIGPCTAKKMEYQREEVAGLMDCVLTFEELQAMIDSRDIELSELEEDILDNASYYGRIFARSGGLSDAVAQALAEHGITEEQFRLDAAVCDGIEQCRIALLKEKKGVLKENFIEGMACVGGCIGGAACLTHEPKDKSLVDKYGQLAKEKTIQDTIGVLNLIKK